MAVLVSGEGSTETGYLVMAADAATPRSVAFYLRHTSGVLGVSLTAERCDELELRPAPHWPGEPTLATPIVPVDLTTRVDRGFSASDRAAVIAALARPGTRPDEFIRPGHVYPLRAAGAGVLAHHDPAAAALDLARLGGRACAGIIAPILRESDGEVARRDELCRFAEKNGLPLVGLEALVAYRVHERPAVFAAAANLPTPFGVFVCYAWEMPDGTEQLALTRPGPAAGPDARTAVHRECTAGNVLGSRGCDCRARLQRELAELGDGQIDVLVYLRAASSRGSLDCVRAPRTDLPDLRRGSMAQSRDDDLPTDVVCAQILDELPRRSLSPEVTSV